MTTPYQRVQISNETPINRRRRIALAVLYLCVMGMCSITLCALGATLPQLASRASNGKEDALDVASIYIVRGIGAVLGAACSSSIFKACHGNHALSLSLTTLAMVLLLLPACRDMAAFHSLFILMGFATATLDTGVQIMTRKAHEGTTETGVWLGANTVSFGVSGAIVPFVSLATSNRLLYIYLVFVAFALVNSVALLLVKSPKSIEHSADPVSQNDKSLRLRTGGKNGSYCSPITSSEDTGSIVPNDNAINNMRNEQESIAKNCSCRRNCFAYLCDPKFTTERLVGLLVFFLIGGQVAMVSFIAIFVDDEVSESSRDTGSFVQGKGMYALAGLWGAITAGRFVGLLRQIQISRDDRRKNFQDARGDNESIRRLFFDVMIFLVLGTIGTVLLFIATVQRSKSSSFKDSGGRHAINSLSWLGTIIFGFGNGPLVGYLYDLAHRSTEMSEQGTATVMLGLNLGASLVPWIAAKVWDASGEPVTLVAVAFVSMTAPFCILLVVAARKYVAKKHERLQACSALVEGDFSGLTDRMLCASDWSNEKGMELIDNSTMIIEADDGADMDVADDGKILDVTSTSTKHQGQGYLGKRLNISWSVAMAILSISSISFVCTLVNACLRAKQNSEASTETLRIAARSDYIDLYGPIATDYPWVVEGSTVVVDVGKSIELYATGVAEGCNVTWLVDSGRDHHAGPPATWQGKFKVPGVYAAELTEHCPASWKASLSSSSPVEERTVSGSIISTHVRREIRDLLPEDMDSLVEAMLIMYETPTERGQEKYGADFVGLDTFQLWHHTNAAQRDADQIHQGVGFLLQHAKITLLFERSLQSINYQLSLPYWDTTIEMAKIESNVTDSIWDPVIWSPKLFGSVLTYSDELQELSDEALSDALYGSDTAMRRWAIPDGPFAYFRQPQHLNTTKDADTTSGALPTPRNAYGLLRAPWNNNPSPYVTRYPSKRAILPDCFAHRTYALEEGGPSSDHENGKGWSMTSWMYGISNIPHGKMHSVPGGTVTLHKNQALVDLVGNATASNYRQHTLWRFRVIDFPSFCASDAPVSTCAPTCNLNLYNLQDVGYEVLKSQFIMPSTEELASYDDVALENIGQAFCDSIDVIVSGDAKDSGGCVEPSFWPIHGTLERLYQYRILKGPGFRTDAATEWPSEHHSEIDDFGASSTSSNQGATCFGARSNGVDPDRLCMKSEAYDDHVTGRPQVGNDADCCTGHHPDSRIYPSYPANEETAVGWTNREMLALMDPQVGPNFAYPVYHHFKWPHCAELGLPFD